MKKTSYKFSYPIHNIQTLLPQCLLKGTHVTKYQRKNMIYLLHLTFFIGTSSAI